MPPPFILYEFLCILFLILYSAAPNGPAVILSGASAVAAWQRHGWRFQLWPVYISLLLAATSLTDQTNIIPLLLVRIAVAVAVPITLITSFIFPIGILPKPSGPYMVGHGVEYLKQRDMEIVLRAYFPAEPRLKNQRRVRAKYQPKRLDYPLHGSMTCEGHARFVKLPKFLMEGLRATRPHVFANTTLVAPAPAKAKKPSTEKLPLIIFSHGLGGAVDSYTTLISDLVSHGNIVVAVEHADGSGAYTEFEDNTYTMYQPLTPVERKEELLEYQRRHNQLLVRVAEVQAALRYTLAASAGKTKANAERFNGVFKNRIDPDRLAVMGHSFGGATAIAAAAVEPRFGVSIVLDAWSFPLPLSLTHTGLPVGRRTVSIFAAYFESWKSNSNVFRTLLLDKCRRAVKEEAGKLSDDADIPIRFQVKDPRNVLQASAVHFKGLKLKNCNAGPDNYIGTVDGTHHNSFSDFIFFVSGIAFRNVKNRLSPREAMRRITTAARLALDTAWEHERRREEGDGVPAFAEVVEERLNRLHVRRWEDDPALLYRRGLAAQN